MKAFRPVEGDPPAGAREARTLYEIEKEWPALGLTLLRCRLVTGRTHQIRVHLGGLGSSHRGRSGLRPRPLSRKSPTRSSASGSSEFPRQALHAERVAFHHPATQELVEIVAPIPADLAGLVAALDAAR